MGKIVDRLSRKAGRERLPLISAFELLPVCNLKCKMCYVRKDMSYVQAHGGLIRAGQWLDWAEQARDGGLLFPLLTGGEPFLHPDFFEIYEGMMKLGLQISVNTNGTMITEEIAKWFSAHCPVRLNITLYGASADTYQRQCGDGTAFKRVHQAVSWLKQYGIPVKFNCSVTPDNVGDLEEIIRYAKSVGSPVQVATYMFPPVRRTGHSGDYADRLSPEDAAKARVLADWLQNDPQWFRGMAASFRHFVPLDKLELGTQEDWSPMPMDCRAGRCSFWIDWQGNIGNCGMYSSAGSSLKGRAFMDAWREVVAQTDAVRYAPACSRCPNQRRCHPCIAMVCSECGSNTGIPEYMCRYNAASARYYQKWAEKLPQTEELPQSVELPDCSLEEF